MVIARSLWRIATFVWLPMLVVAVWWKLSAGSDSIYFPPLQSILTELRDLWVWQHAREDLLPSLMNLFAGYALAGFVGIAIAALMWRSDLLARTSHPLIYFFYVLPPPALLPLMIQVFGIDARMKIAMIFLTCLWPVLLNSVDGMRSTDRTQLDVATVHGLSTVQTLLRVVLPSALPQIFTGLRIALAFGIILMVVSEMVAANRGIGYFVLYAQQTFAITEMWTGIIVVAVVGSLLNLLFVLIERRIIRWN